jgi:hypothetical protein
MANEIIERYNKLQIEATDLLEETYAELYDNHNKTILDTYSSLCDVVDSFNGEIDDVFYYIERNKEIPELLKVEGWKLERDSNGNTPLMSLVLNDGDYSGASYEYHQTDRNNDGNTPIMLSIIANSGVFLYHKFQYLQYKGWKTDRNKAGYTPIILSFIHNGYKYNPDYQCAYDGWQTDRDNDGNTLIMIVIIDNSEAFIRNSFQYLQYEGWQSDKNNAGNTPLMLYIIHSKYCYNIYYFQYKGFGTDKNNNEETPLMLWTKYHNEPFPDRYLN